MRSPSYIRPRTSLSAAQTLQLVRMRQAGATWKEIGRVFGKQDGACKAIFEKARAAQARSAPA